VLARSGAFGLVLVDLGSFVPTLGVLSRLAGLARAHEAAIVLMTEKSPERASLGSVVSLRADVSSGRAADGSFATTLAVTRDRVRATPWRIVEPRRGPPGLS
jgi:recombination protein RecA